MAAGLQCWDENGNLILDATYRVMRLGGSRVLTDGVNDSITDDILLQGGWYSFAQSGTRGDGYLSGGIIIPRFSISGNVLSWTWAPKNNQQYDTYLGGIVFWGGR